MSRPETWVQVYLTRTPEPGPPGQPLPRGPWEPLGMRLWGQPTMIVVPEPEALQPTPDGRLWRRVR